MRLPAPLSRRKSAVHKNTFGHVLVLAGSRDMLGAAALTALAAMRSGAGLVTVGIPKSLQTTLQRILSPVIMTMPLPETPEKTLALSAFPKIQAVLPRFQALAIGPGLSHNPLTQKLIQKILATTSLPMVIDADALSQVTCQDGSNVKRQTSNQANNTVRIITPHVGEMARMTGKPKSWIEKNREEAAQTFAAASGAIVLLKGPRTIVASPGERIHINKTGNSGMASAGSGDVLTGMIAAFLGQELSAFEAAKWGAHLHGLAGDLAARHKTRTAMIATDIINAIPEAISVTLSKNQKVKK